MAKKYIDADLLRKAVEKQIDYAKGVYPKGSMEEARASAITAVYRNILASIDSLQQEQPIKVYRVENEKEQKGLWRKFDGTWEPLFDMLTDGQCKDVPMDDSPIYREGGKQWFACAPSKKTLQKWFSKRDLEELTAAGFTITEFEVVEYRKLSDFEYIFTRESIVNKTNINVVDIYPQEQPSNMAIDLDVIFSNMKRNEAIKQLEYLNKVYGEQSCDTCTNDKGCVTCKDGELWEGKEQPSEDLEAEMEKYFDGWIDDPEYGQAVLPHTYECVGVSDCKDIARHFANWQKEQMLKAAVEGEAHPDDCEIWVNLVGYGYKYNEGDKIKIIIVSEKEDKK